MKDGIREKARLGESNPALIQTPVQIALVKKLECKDALLIVKDAKAKVKY